MFSFGEVLGIVGGYFGLFFGFSFWKCARSISSKTAASRFVRRASANRVSSGTSAVFFVREAKVEDH